MKSNFEIIDTIAVTLNGAYFDLHNNFEFRKVSESENGVEIEFCKSTGDWIDKNEFEILKFNHQNVTFKNSEKGINFEFPEDENTLSFLSFFPNSLREINDEFMTHSKPNKNDDIIYYFENGKILRISCEYVELTAQK